jgi:hypothetical protein
MSDDGAKKGIGIAMLAGLALGLLWVYRLGYGVIEVRAWNVVGLVLIATLTVFAIVAALRGFASVRAAERGGPPPRA